MRTDAKTARKIGALYFDEETILEVKQLGGGGSGVGGANGLNARNLVTGEDTGEVIAAQAEQIAEQGEEIDQLTEQNTELQAENVRLQDANAELAEQLAEAEEQLANAIKFYPGRFIWRVGNGSTTDRIIPFVANIVDQISLGYVGNNVNQININPNIATSLVTTAVYYGNVIYAKIAAVDRDNGAVYGFNPAHVTNVSGATYTSGAGYLILTPTGTGDIIIDITIPQL